MYVLQHGPRVKLRCFSHSFSDTFYIKGTLSKASGVSNEIVGVEITPPVAEMFQIKKAHSPKPLKHDPSEYAAFQ